MSFLRLFEAEDAAEVEAEAETEEPAKVRNCNASTTRITSMGIQDFNWLRWFGSYQVWWFTLSIGREGSNIK